MTEKLPTKLMAAHFVRETPAGNLWSSDTEIDKMEMPSEYHDIVRMCRFFYEHDGFAYTTINKMVDIGINGYAVNPGTCSQKELKVYESLNDLMIAFLRNAALEYLISGLIVPEASWEDKYGTKLDPKLRKMYVLPADLWHRDPLSIEIKKTPLPNRLSVFVNVDDNDVFFIMSGGTFPDGTKDVEAYKELADNYPEFVAAVKRGEKKFKLENAVVIRRFPKSGTQWPTPFLTPALELLLHKRNLRKMDYAIASRVISAIQLFKLGNDEYPVTEDDADVMESLRSEIQWRGTGNYDRVFQLFANHTLSIDWIMPDVEALLSSEKYMSVNEDILVALGIPRIIVSGETLRSGSSNAEMAMLPPTNSIDAMRNILLEFPKHIYRQMQEHNKFKGVPEPYYPPIRLQDLTSLAEIGRAYYENGVISRTTWAEMGSINFNTEAGRMALEKEIMEKLGLQEHAPVPFSPKPETVKKDNKQDNENPDKESEEK